MPDNSRICGDRSPLKQRFSGRVLEERAGKYLPCTQYHFLISVDDTPRIAMLKLNPSSDKQVAVFPGDDPSNVSLSQDLEILAVAVGEVKSLYND